MLFVNHALSNPLVELDDNEIYTATKIDLDISTCSMKINKKEIIAKESADLYSLDLKNNRLIVTDKGVSVIADFTIADTKMIFNDKHKYESLDAYIIIKDKIPILKYKNKKEACFYYIISFSK